MNTFCRVFAALLLLRLAAGLSGCASTSNDPNSTEHEKVSTVPWGRPESWEGKGTLGGMMQ